MNKKNIKNLVRKVFGEKIFKVLYYIYKTRINDLHPRFIGKILIKIILNKKVFVKYNNEVLFSVRDYGGGTKSRADQFFSKNGEIETINWILDFEPNSKFLDVGANIGLFSLLAAKKNHNVVSIEPEAHNFTILNLNVFDNGFNDNVICYPIALASQSRLSKLNIFKMGWGHSMHSLGTDIMIGGIKQNPVFKQGSFGMNLDDFIEQTQFFPNYVKIDVDGNELDVIHGFPKLLKSKSIKSIMIEIDPHDNESKNKIFSHMLENFFFIDAKISTKSNYFFKKKLI
jgi:FkbM family methyltransferase